MRPVETEGKLAKQGETKGQTDCSARDHGRVHLVFGEVVKTYAPMALFRVGKSYHPFRIWLEEGQL